jgi:pyruvate dehydrogenase (quinone)
MKPTVSDFIIKRLSAWGIRRVFGYPGDGINGILGALNRNKDTMEFIQVRHEEMAAFMACAHAKFTGEVGVCMATSGPGAIHLLNGLYDAKADHQPVVAIVGQTGRMALGGHYQQEVDLMSLFKDVASDYIQMATDPVQVRHLIDRAVRIAKATRSVTCVIIPGDLQEMEAVEVPPQEHYSVRTGIGHPEAKVIPTDNALKNAAAILNEGKKIAMLVGAGAKHASDEVLQVAELLGAGVAKALLGKTVVSDNVSYVTGSIGFFGTEATASMMQECDTLFMIGTSFPYAEYLPKEGQAKAVQIDIDGKMLSLRYPVDVNLLGDCKETLQLLIPMLKKKEERSWRKKIEQDVVEWNQERDKRSMIEGEPINPQLVFTELSKRIPDRTIFTADSGSTSSWYARDIIIRPGMDGSVSGSLASMGCSVPYAIAAKLAHPDRPVIAFVGDGAMQMNGNEELLTLIKYSHKWNNPVMIICVLNNKDLNMVTWEERMKAGDPKFDASQNIPEFNYAKYAESIGMKGIRVESPEQVGTAWEEALKANQPVLIDVLTDPEIAPYPMHVLKGKIKNLASAVMKGDRGPLKTAGKEIKQKTKSES